jgi:hypothetical protein
MTKVVTKNQHPVKSISHKIQRKLRIYSRLKSSQKRTIERFEETKDEANELEIRDLKATRPVEYKNDKYGILNFI